MGKFTFQHIYEFPWELVTHTHLTKYPTEKETNIVGSQIVDARKGGICIDCLLDLVVIEMFFVSHQKGQEIKFT
jgi:hypothetical protein